MKIDKIILSGLAGSGKTTIGKLLADRLDWDFVSIGEFSREYAEKEYNMDILSFQELCLKNPEIDKKIDSYFSEKMNNATNVVIDYRLGFHFIKNSFNVFLYVSEQEAVNRLSRANRTKEFKDLSYESIKNSIKERNKKMRNRFIKFYGVDFTDISNYHLVINTDKFQNFTKIAELIIKLF